MIRALAITAILAGCAVDQPPDLSSSDSESTELDAYYQWLIDNGQEAQVPCTWQCRCECDPPGLKGGPL